MGLTREQWNRHLGPASRTNNILRTKTNDKEFDSLVFFFFFFFFFFSLVTWRGSKKIKKENLPDWESNPGLPRLFLTVTSGNHEPLDHRGFDVTDVP